MANTAKRMKGDAITHPIHLYRLLLGIGCSVVFMVANLNKIIGYLFLCVVKNQMFLDV